ncbi:MAG: sigma-70 family RNA polymerase sigma factor [Candidatus Sumerlaeota bacterium]
MARMRDAGSAEVLTQEVFLRAFFRYDRKRGVAAFGPWVVCVTRNLATDWSRRQQTVSKVVALVPLHKSQEAANVADETQSAAERMSSGDDMASMNAALDQMPEDVREIVLLHFMENMPKREIADRLGVHPSTVGRQIDKALLDLRESMAPCVSDALRPKRRSANATGKTLAVIAVLAALPETARATLIGSAAFQQGASVIADVPVSPDAIAPIGAKGSVIMKAGSVLIAGFCAVVMMGFAFFYMGIAKLKVAEDPGEKALAANTAMSSDLPSLPEGWTLSVTSNPGGQTSLWMSDNSFRATSLGINNAIGLAWDTTPKNVDPKLAANSPAFDFDLRGTATATKKEFNDALRVELQRAFGFRVSTETIKLACVILEAPNGVPKSFQASQEPSLSMIASPMAKKFTGINMDEFAHLIGAETNTQVFNNTNLVGRFDFVSTTLFYSDNDLMNKGFMLRREIRDVTALRISRP